MINHESGNSPRRKQFMPGKKRPWIHALFALLLFASAAQPCTFFMATVNGITFFGNNEDSGMSDTHIWFIPPEEGKYGCVFVSYSNGFPQGGMNDRGLSFDGASTPRVRLKFSKEKIAVRGYLTRKIMEECASIEEVVNMVATYKYPDLSGQGQLLFADADGDALIVGGPSDTSDIDVIRKDPKESSMVLTNFFPSHPELGGHPCMRYMAATSRLEKDPSPTVSNFRSILKAVANRNTQYSNIFDLNNRVIHLYRFHDFNTPIILKLSEELAEGAHAYKIADMFEESVPEAVIRDLNERRAKGKISRMIPEFRAFKAKAPDQSTSNPEGGGSSW